ncbi:unnamed protein product [Plutella xylostella]|uniref:(diamondback moth) hypothetical protein n=1 Tax=Plutella xylostella TaxID=51655 RepID=A0A8S4G0R5_PLUXY|nr:unnamed protein product [Plutella xylostella]
MCYSVQLLQDVLEAWRREVEKKPPSMSLAAAYSALGLGAGAHDEAAVRRAYYRLAQLHHPDKNPEGRAWRREVEKKPPSMSLAAAYSALGLGAGAHDEAAVRRAYYRLAQLHHPDKNPEGRDRFEEVNQAYEFLCSRTAWTGDGPSTDNIVLILRTQTILFQRYSDVNGLLVSMWKLVVDIQFLCSRTAYTGDGPSADNIALILRTQTILFQRYSDGEPSIYSPNRTAYTGDGDSADNIVLILRTQTILFQRCSDVLAPYKYAGYPQLLRTVRLETEAERLFSATGSALLPAACELAHATVRCSALNAEQLARDQGILVYTVDYRHQLATRVVAFPRTVRLETEAERLFSATGSALLPAACELAHATVRCSALNAEQLARDQGILRLETEAERLFSATGSALLPAACELAHATVRCSALNAEQLARDQGILIYMSQATGLISCLIEPLARSLDGAVQLYD